MSQAVAPLLVLVLALNFAVLGTSRLRGAINASATQGALLGALTLAVHRDIGVRTLAVALGAGLLKGVAIPFMLGRAMREVNARREIEPFIGYSASLLLGAAATGLSILFAGTLPLAPEHEGSLLVPTALATFFTGFIVLVSRRKAVTQVVGYVLLENGVFIMGLCLIEAMPFLIEVGVLLDVFVAIFVLGIIAYHINREFASLDTTHLSKLKE
jgi:hydrogenase-4 component E